MPWTGNFPDGTVNSAQQKSGIPILKEAKAEYTCNE
jgi:hypothetical protein